ncbi:hypothetical protein ACFVU2_19510 [Leifsonia sp. NPDC058194]|uniref:hypothetical protein n=1 Tax=Leifsonia sp. NPDC058194 TaxID=3346374 RepID=UPI0036DA3F0D
MAEQISTQTTKPPTRKLRRRTVAIIAAAAIVLAGGITVSSVSAANAASAETARECAAAIKSDATATENVTTDVKAADELLLKVKSVDLPGGEGWKSRSYLSRPGADAVKAVPASAGVAAVAGTPARHSAAWLINDVIAARDTLAATKAATKCVDRTQAKRIATAAKTATADTAALATTSKVLLADFTTFQTEEHARVAAEVAAAKKAAEEAAAAAAAAAAAQAAAQAAAEEAARQAAARNSYSGGSSSGGGGYSGGSSSGGGGSSSSSGGGGGYHPPSGGGPIGGGGVGTPGQGNQCKTSNGMGGTTNC